MIACLAFACLLVVMSTSVSSQTIYVLNFPTATTFGVCNGTCAVVGPAATDANLTVGTPATSTACLATLVPANQYLVITDNGGTTATLKFYNDSLCTVLLTNQTAPYATCIPSGYGFNVQFVKATFGQAACPAAAGSSSSSSGAAAASSSSSAGSSTGGVVGSVSGGKNSATVVGTSSLAVVALVVITGFLSRRL